MNTLEGSDWVLVEAEDGLDQGGGQKSNCEEKISFSSLHSITIRNLLNRRRYNDSP
jgi:hypothetical protein